jgi:hypothetical protein
MDEKVTLINLAFTHTLNNPNLNLCALQDELPQSLVHMTREHMISCIVDLEPQSTQVVLMCTRRRTGVAR